MTDTTDPKNKIIRTWWDRFAIRDGMTVEQRRNLRKSLVRVLVTYAAAIHLFIFGPIFCWWLVTHAADTEGVTVVGIDQAKDIFLATFPISTGIIAYWFAARGRSQ